MQLKRLLVVVAMACALGFAPQTTYAANANFFGPIISPECHCEGKAPDWGCVLQTVQNTVNLSISLAVMFAVLVIAYAGFLFMTSSVTAQNREKARTVLLHAVIGLVIALSAWLIVDFVMKTLYNEDSDFGPWNTILSGDRRCLLQIETPQGNVTGGTTNSDGIVVTDTPSGTADGTFAYDPGISAQRTHGSGKLNTLLHCIAQTVPGNVGRVSSISDSNIASGAKTFAQCAGGGCNHTAHSCHYGGTQCVGASYAVDFGDQQNASTLRSAATQCAQQNNLPSLYMLNEGDHLHISIDGNRCDCDN